MEKYAISVDWLQVCCYCRNVDELINTLSVCNAPDSTFWSHVTESPTRTFKTLARIYTKVGATALECAELLAVPVNGVINPHIVLLKINNRFLYYHGYITLLYRLVGYYKLSIKGLTRLDLCYDCNKFHGGLKPSRFLKTFMTAEYDSPSFIYKTGAKEFRAYGSKSYNSVSRYSGVEFGSGKSAKRCYIYDKTQELKEVKDKPWIRECWERNGLASDDKTHVFRCEISIKCDGMDLLNMSTGQLFKLSPHYMENQPNIEKLFHFYAAKLFDFRRKGNHNRLRDYDKVELFENSPLITCKPIKVCGKADTGRTELICANKLARLSYTYTDMASQYSEALRKSICFLEQVGGIKFAKARLAESIQGLEAYKTYKSMDSEYIEYFALVEALSQIRYDPATYIAEGDTTDIQGSSLFDDSLFVYYQYKDYCDSQKHSCPNCKNTPSGARRDTSTY